MHRFLEEALHRAAEKYRRADHGRPTMSDLSGPELLRMFIRYASAAKRHPRAFDNFFKLFVVPIFRNPPLAQSLVDILEGKPDGSPRLIAYAGKLELLRATSGVEKAPKDFAREIAFNEHIRKMEGVNHLGAIASISEIAASRWTYAMFIAGAALELKNQGLGLGHTDEELKKKTNIKMTKMAVIQAWGFLLNYGHLFGTFSTERALFYDLLQSPSDMNKFKESIDEKVRRYAEEQLNAHSLFHFHYVLAAFRLSRLPTGNFRNKCLDLLAHFWEQDGKPIAESFRSARRLGSNRLQSLLKVGFTIRESDYHQLIQQHRKLPNTYGVDDGESLARRLLKTIDEFSESVLFASPKVAGLVLAHLRAWRQWKTKRAGSDIVDLIPELYSQPPDWPKQAQEPLTHLGRIRCQEPHDMECFAEVRRWLGSDPDGPRSVWRGTNFIVTPTHDKGLVVDFYGDSTSRLPVLHLLKQALRMYASHKDDLHFQYSLADLLLNGWLASFSEASIRFQMKQVPGAKRFIALADSWRNLGDEVRAHSNELTVDDPRRMELKATLSLCEEHSKRPEVQVVNTAMLSAVRVVGSTGDDNNREIGEIDGLCLCVDARNDAWFLTLLEHKAARAGSGQGQLVALGKLLRLTPDGPPQRLSKDNETTVLVFRSPSK